MKLALGLRGRDIKADNMRLAKQLGCASVVITPFCNTTVLPKDSIFATKTPKPLTVEVDKDAYSFERLRGYVETAESLGLEVGAVENLSPLDTFDILLDGKEKFKQIENVKQIIRNVSKAGIKTLGYNFNVAGVYGRREICGRGNAKLFEFEDEGSEEDIPLGMVWNRVYDFYPKEGFLSAISKEEIFSRYAWFLSEIINVAENENVTLALHPTDPPTETAMKTARLINCETDMERVYSLAKSDKNKLLFCLGTVAEMKACDVYGVLERQLERRKVAYLHIRNVSGKVPHYTETFIDDGDVDIKRVIELLFAQDFEGVIMPDHTPTVSADNVFQTGMAYSLGYLRALIDACR